MARLIAKIKTPKGQPDLTVNLENAPDGLSDADADALVRSRLPQIEEASGVRLQRAAEQGYGDTWYRGVTQSAPDLEDRPGMMGRGVYMTTDPNAAGDYAMGKVIGREGDAGNVMQLRHRAGNIFDWDNATKADEIRVLEAAGLDVSETKAIPDSDYTFDRGWLMEVLEGRDLADVMKKAGYDGATALEAFDAGGVPTGEPYQSLVVFDPKNIRSVNAQFDPAKRDSSDLLAGIQGAAPMAGLGAGALVGGALASDEAEAVMKPTTLFRMQNVGRSGTMPGVKGKTFVRPQQELTARLYDALRQQKQRYGEPVFDADPGKGADGSTRYTLPDEYSRELERVGASTPPLVELPVGSESAKTFTDRISNAKQDNKFGAAVYVYPEADYGDMRLFLTEDGTAGYALKPDGDLVSAFSTGQHKGVAPHLLLHGIEQGATKLDAFDTILPELYAQLGFREGGRLRWDESQAPDDWDKQVFSQYNEGEPDVSFMGYDAREAEPVDPRYVDEYGEALAGQERVIQPDLPADRSTLRGTNRKFKEGIYKDPDVLLAEASAQMVPESPNLKRVWGVTRADLADVSQRQGNQEVNLLGAAANPKGTAHGGLVTKPANTRRLVEALEHAKGSDLAEGMTGWYVQDPKFQRMVELFGPEEAVKRYNRLNIVSGIHSANADVGKELIRGSAANYAMEQGMLDDYLRYGGKAGQAPGPLASVPGHFAHKTAHGIPLARYAQSGIHESQSPKVPAYVQASGVPETGFQTSFPVGDAHFSRAIGLADVRPEMKGGPGESWTMPEAQQLAPWWRDKVAGQVGLEAVPGQALAWGLYGPQTGVKTGIGAPKLEIEADLIVEAAKREGLPVDTVRDEYLAGKRHLADMAAGERGSADPRLLAGLAGLGVAGAAALAPEDAEAAFAGLAAKSADTMMADMAAKMLDAGISRDEVWQKTGWMRGPDGKMRFEIDDSGLTLKDMPLSSVSNEYGPMTERYQGDLSGYAEHDELFQNYPIGGRTVLRETPGRGGSFTNFGQNQFSGGKDTYGIDVGRDGPPGSKRETLAHELQHAIQASEGFAFGGSPNAPYRGSELADTTRRIYNELKANPANANDSDDAILAHAHRLANQPEARRDVYNRLAGEVEARNVQTRLDYTPEQRRDFPPWATQDVPTEQQIVRMGEDARARQMNQQLRAARAAQPQAPITALSQTRNVGDLAELAGNKLTGLAGLGGMMGRGLAGIVGGVFENAINRTPYGALINGVDELDFSISGVMDDIDGMMRTMTQGMEFTPEMMDVMGDIRGGLEGLGMPPGVIDAYLEGVDPYARKTQEWFTEKGYPRVGEEAGAAMRLGEMVLAPI